MPEIRFACPACNEILEAPDDLAGEAVECPTCGQSMSVPTAGAGSADEPAPTAAKCPGCGAGLEPDAVLCVACGYHMTLGRKISTEFS